VKQRKRTVEVCYTVSYSQMTGTAYWSWFLSESDNCLHRPTFHCF